jgi:hypothetical protein
LPARFGRAGPSEYGALILSEAGMRLVKAIRGWLAEGGE